METTTREFPGQAAKRAEAKDELVRLLALKALWPSKEGREEFKTELHLTRAIEKAEREAYRPRLMIAEVDPEPEVTPIKRAFIAWCRDRGERFVALRKTPEVRGGGDPTLEYYRLTVRNSSGWYLIGWNGGAIVSCEQRAKEVPVESEKTTTERGVELEKCAGCGDNVYSIEYRADSVAAEGFCVECVSHKRHVWPQRWRQEYIDLRELGGIASDLADIEMDDDEGTGIASRLAQISRGMAVRFDRRRQIQGELFSAKASGTVDDKLLDRVLVEL